MVLAAAGALSININIPGTDAIKPIKWVMPLTASPCRMIDNNPPRAVQALCEQVSNASSDLNYVHTKTST